MSKVFIKEIKEILGVKTNSLTELCRHEKINMFSRHKPIVYPGIPRNERYFESIHNNFGISVPEQGISVAEHGWIYQRPSGGINAPYRIDDFRGYNHAAEPVLKRLETEYTVEIIRDPVLRVNFNTGGEISVYEVVLDYPAAPNEALVSSLGELYIVMDIVQEGKTLVTLKSDRPIGGGGLNLTYNCSALKAGIYYLRFHLTTSLATHHFEIYADKNMPNPARLEVITPSGSDSFVCNVLGTADGEKTFKNLEERQTVYFNTTNTVSAKSGLYLIADLHNNSTSGLQINWPNFAIQMKPNFYPAGITALSLYDDEVNGEVFSNSHIRSTEYGIQIPAKSIARIGIYLSRRIAEGEALLEGEYTLTATLAYNSVDIWNGVLLLNAISTY